MPLLGLVVRMKTVTSGVNIVAVRDRVYEELRAFAGAGRNAGIPQDPLRAAHYALAATVDDVVMNTPWGAHGGWSKRTMVSAFHGDVEGGENFYKHLDNMLQAPAANRLTLELMYCCLSLGFEGRYRLHPRGASEHAKVRENLYNTLRGLMGPQERELSPEWRGVDMPARSSREGLPIWVFAAAAGVFLLGLYWGMSFLLGSNQDTFDDRFGRLLPNRSIQIPMIAPPARPPSAPPLPPPAPPPPPVVTDASQRLRQLLEPEIRANQVSVEVFGRDTRITIHDSVLAAGRGMFDSGKADVRQEFVGLLRRIGEELQRYPGRVRVDGHTDNVPISRANLRFPTNQVLSEARATSAAAIIAERLGDASRIVTRGFADQRPIADNSTDQGKANNRRIVVTLESPQ
jgi:type VI secretion system protein ImpK